MNGMRAIVAAICLSLSASFAFTQQGPDPTMEDAKRLYRNRDFANAVPKLQEVLTGGDRADALYLLGYSHLMNREFDESVEAFSRCFAIEPRFDPREIYQRPVSDAR